MEVTGDGFPGDSSLLTVDFGGNPCDVFNTSTTTITCQLGDNTRTHTIENTGTHPTYGYRYEWMPTALTIEKGDTVQWRWQPPPLVTGMVFKVCETSNASATTCLSGGFDSGSASSVGSYAYQFLDVGNYTYWSGYVDSRNTIFFRGTIRVTTKGSSSSSPISVKVNGVEAHRVPVSKRHVRAVVDLACPVVGDLPGCSESLPASDKLSFTYATCSTPSVTNMTMARNLDDYTLYIHGEGFGADLCQCSVWFLDQMLDVTYVTSNAVTARFVPGSLAIGINYDLRRHVTVWVNGLGTAAIEIPENIDTKVRFEPYISSVSPEYGSCSGGTTLTITGLHFSDPSSTTTVRLSSSQCVINELSYNNITCITPALVVDAANTLTVQVTTPYGTHDATCATSFIFTCRLSDTPTIDAVTPNETDGTSSVTVTGSGFGTNPSDIEIYFGTIPGTISSVGDTSVTVDLPYTAAGTHDISLIKNPVGNATGTVAITFSAVITSLSSSSGSINGGLQIELIGVGFVPERTAVSIDGVFVDITSVSPTSIIFYTPSHAAGVVAIDVTSNGVAYPSESFTYDIAGTAVVSSVNPSQGGAGESITITGTGFSAVCSENLVIICDQECGVTTCTSSSINCTLSACAAGNYDVKVTVAGTGNATTSVQFTYPLAVTSITPITGSFGGGQVVTATGAGFDEGSTNVTICGSPCPIVSATTSELQCQVPSATDDGSGTVQCSVEVASGMLTETYSSQYTYNASLTPVVSSVSPTRGGTGGGTLLTISGSGFGTTLSDVAVDINGTACVVTSVNDSDIQCTTGPHRPSVRATVVVAIGANGNSTSANATFHYIDIWSSVYTWGESLTLPEDGDMVVVAKDETLMIDQDTPILSMLLIKGGTVIFDEKDVELNSENILIVDGGTLQIGTEDAPFQHKATITLHGNLRAAELPIYGAKALALREGTLDLHGKPIQNTWTRLTTTASAGATTLVVEHDVSDWEVGSLLVIASTGDRHSQRENEQHYIAAISVDGKTITLNDSLSYDHLGVSETINGVVVEMRAEVGLLSRNVRVRGSDDIQWHDAIEACPDGFNTGEFATQTCFQGRFGDEMGSDQFGGHIIMHAPRKDEGLVTGRFSYIELMYMGQAFRLGRYPIHFHLNGDMTGSYVRGCGIHNTFNRAVNIHGTHRVVVEKTVIYNVMGGAFFLEDGIETGNTFQHNLAVFVKSSTSLLNDDITPAAFWITNPNNTVQHNAAAGGTHFGFWYRMHDHPDGPSFDASICPKKIELGVFFNNSVHSQGWFGLWIFQDYFPMQGSSCDSTIPAPAVFERLITWNCEKGAEWVNCGAMQFKDFVAYNHEKAGIEMKLIVDGTALPYDDNGAMISGSQVIGYVPSVSSSSECTTTGIILPFSAGLILKGNTFSNFDRSGCSALGVTTVDGMCTTLCGGWRYEFYNTTWGNATNRARLRWEHECVLKDMDGSLTGVNGSSIVPTYGLLPQSSCSDSVEFGKGFSASRCSSEVKFKRMAFNNPSPSSLEGKDCIFSNAFGATAVPFLKKRLTHTFGWMALLVEGYDTNIYIEDVDHITNISYSGLVYDFEENDCVILTHNFTQKPDRFAIIPGQDANSTDDMVTCPSNYNGDYYFNTTSNDLSFILNGKDRVSKRATSPVTKDRPINLAVYRCFYLDCIPPPDPSTIPPSDSRPSNATFWSDPSTWDGTEAGYGGNYGNGTYGLPLEGDDVKIRGDQWVVVDTVLPNLGKIYVYGVLEFEYLPKSDGSYWDFDVIATHIIVSGGRLIAGWPKSGDHFKGRLQIKLQGDHHTPDMPLPGGPNLGAKALGIFGGLDLHGIPRNMTWTKLNVTATAGSSVIVIDRYGDWEIGDKLAITSTSFGAKETEERYITAISGQTITLDRALSYDHIVHTVTSPELERVNKSFTMAAEVGLLTRNIKIIGDDYSSIVTDAFGARVLVGMYSYGSNVYRGWARISNAEFFQGGQLGWNEPYDPRYAMAWLDTGDVIPARPSYLRDCAFHDGFATAIGLFGANGIVIENNVVHRPVGPGMVVEGENHEIRNNLLTKVLWAGSYNNRDEPFNFFWDAAIQVNGAESIFLEGNVVGGSERVGYRIKGEECGSTGLWKRNEAHSVLIGTLQFPGDEMPSGCTKLSGFTVWKAYYFGFYSQTGSRMTVEDNVLADNVMGIFNIIFRPPALSHLIENKPVIIKNNLLVGDSGASSCNDVLSSSGDNNIKNSVLGRSWTSGDKSNGWAGIGWYGSLSGPNPAPTKPFITDMTYPSLGGLMRIEDTIFYGFDGDRCNRRNFLISTNPAHEDQLQPIYVSNVTLIGVDEESIAFFHRADVSKANPSDCVDMVCDAKQHCFIKDMDGSLLGGSAGTILPDGAYEWDGDPRRGTGDYRIPNAPLTDAAGVRLAVEDVCPKKGIVGTADPGCTFHSTWRAFKCQNSIDYAQMVIESMDEDTELRRLSPVALIGDKYVDLLNGPQDHGWCAGYTCQKRISTFWPLVALGKHYDIYFTSTSPEHLRLRLLNVNTNDALTAAINYRLPQRYDVYYLGVYVPPNNRATNSDGDDILLPPTTPGQYVPVHTDAVASNYFDRDLGLLYVVVKGVEAIDVKRSSVLVIGFEIPAMTVDEFFGKNIVQNLAIFLGIPQEKVRFVSAVNAQSSRRRRAVSSDTMTVTLEIGDPPTSGMNDSVTDPLSYNQLTTMQSSLIDATQTNTLGAELNTTIKAIDVVGPAPPVSDPDYSSYVNTTSDDTVDASSSVGVPASLVIVKQPRSRAESHMFVDQPELRMKDADGNVLGVIGSEATTWTVHVSLQNQPGNHPNATLIGTTEVAFGDEGRAVFTDLLIAYRGENYVLDFAISNPILGAPMTVSSRPFPVPKRQFKLGYSDLPETITVGETFNLRLSIKDGVTNQAATDLGWRGDSWTARIRVHTFGSYGGELRGNKTGTVDTANSEVFFEGLFFTAMSRYLLDVILVSSSNDYEFMAVSTTVKVYPEGYTQPPKDVKKACLLRFSNGYDAIRDSEDAFMNTAYNDLAARYTSVSLDNFAASEGSIVLSFDIEGSTSDTEAVIADLYEALQNGYTIDFNGYTLTSDGSLTIDGTDYSSDVASEYQGGNLTTMEIIIIAVVCGILFIVIIIVIIICIIKKQQLKANTRDVERKNSFKRLDEDLSRYSVLSKDDIYMQWRLTPTGANLPPSDPTLYPAYGKREENPHDMRRGTSPICFKDSFGVHAVGAVSPLIALPRGYKTPVSGRSTPSSTRTVEYTNPVMSMDNPDEDEILQSRPGRSDVRSTGHMHSHVTRRISATHSPESLRQTSPFPTVE